MESTVYSEVASKLQVANVSVASALCSRQPTNEHYPAPVTENLFGLAVPSQ